MFKNKFTLFILSLHISNLIKIFYVFHFASFANKYSLNINNLGNVREEKVCDSSESKYYNKVVFCGDQAIIL